MVSMTKFKAVNALNIRTELIKRMTFIIQVNPFIHLAASYLVRVAELPGAYPRQSMAQGWDASSFQAHTRHTTIEHILYEYFGF